VSAADRLSSLTGLVVDPYFSATKLEWMLRDASVRGRANRGELAAGTIDSWLIWNLTGGRTHATDPTNASRTQLFDIEALAWSEELCELFRIPSSLLPEVRPSSGDFGHAQQSLFGHPVPIAGVAGDQQAALFGQGCWSRGDAKCTYGTGAFLLLNTGPKRPASGGGLLTTIACDATGRPVYALEASIFIAGAAVQWLRDGLGIIAAAADTETLARGVESTGGVYFVPALVGLGAPHWEPRARGAIFGITRGTSRAHLARAALEAMAHSTHDVLEAMIANGGKGSELGTAPLRVDGGATANDWLLQFQADVLDLPVERPDMVETTALGAAGLAGLASGIWPDPGAFLASRKFKRFTPGEGGAAARAGVAEWRRAVRAALSWAHEGTE
jgi:glycerol kinase